MREKHNCKLILADGTEITGTAFGARREGVYELVFNTSMVGYQEILSDPSYTAQAVVMTYPLIGNYGMADDDYETAHPTLGALIVGEYNDAPSSFRSSASLGEVMERWGIPGVQGVDTRRLTRHIRDQGSGKVLLTAMDTPREAGLRLLGATPLPRDVVAQVSTRQRRHVEAENARFHVAVLDCGMKENMLRSLLRRGCSVTVLPYDTSPAEILSLRPDGLLVSNGPGDPTDVPQTMETIRALRGRLPIFGICLGHQLLSLAYGARVYKLKFGHRGGNHPVKNLATGRIEITSQNHSYAVEPASLDSTPSPSPM